VRRPEEAVINRSISSLIAPALLLPIVAAVSLAPDLRDSLAVHAAPLLVFAGGTLLGIATGRGRLVFGVMVLALTMAALIHFGSRTTFYAVAFLLPLNLGVIAWLGETRALSTRGASLLGVLLLQAAAVAVFEVLRPVELGATVEQPLVPVDTTAWLSLPQFAVLAFAAMLGVQVARFVRRRDPLPAAAMWALVASFLALDTAGSGGAAQMHFAAAGVMLAMGTLLEAPGVVHRDSVTGLPASLEFNKVARRLSGRYVIACAAIDDFTAFRNEQGLDVGNRMLRLVGKAFKQVGGGGRAFYLMRDHHFVVVFRHRSVESAKRQLEIVRRAIERAILDVRVAQRTKAGAKAPGAIVERTVAGTISVGIAEPHSRSADAFNVLRDAEEALRSAQVAGMNRIIIHAPAGAAATV
jgi:GGDEF domain-containing protein